MSVFLLYEYSWSKLEYEFSLTYILLSAGVCFAGYLCAVQEDHVTCLDKSQVSSMPNITMTYLLVLLEMELCA